MAFLSASGAGTAQGLLGHTLLGLWPALRQPGAWASRVQSLHGPGQCWHYLYLASWQDIFSAPSFKLGFFSNAPMTLILNSHFRKTEHVEKELWF